jgi:probable rRNA maturation factor
MVEVHCIDVEVPGVDSEFFVSWFGRVLTRELKRLGDINLVFCSDEYLLELNRAHLDHDYYTDIITFDFCEGDLVVGDLFISVDRVQENAADFNVSFVDELHRVCVHGLLHLCGYSDKTTSDELVMREMENTSLLLR